MANNPPKRSSGGGVQSVTATDASITVNNTDPANPTVGLPYMVYP